jgi:glycine/D-amino acid oxidase-like deaminating enzyme
MTAEDADAVVIGGGFYGCVLASYLAGTRGLRRVHLVERESALLQHASYNNQARVHNGYHYPRSFTTAYRSRINLPLFVRAWPAAIRRDFTRVYAIARHNSRVTARQFERFCREIGAPLQPAPANVRQWFEPRLVEASYLVEEYAFDADVLREMVTSELHRCGVQVHTATPAAGIVRCDAGLRVNLEGGGSLACRYVINCTYSGLNQLAGPGIRAGLKQEITEMALVEPPALLGGCAVTLMDGPFFSLMPFPARRLHTLSHVRYTPHLHWSDRHGIDPYRRLQDYPRESRAGRMLRDAARYLPALQDARYVDSLYEVKTVLVRNEGDDGRPILVEKHAELPGAYSILGGKIDNIHDALAHLDKEAFT